jgi:acyl-coenzyme A thioesterase 13
MAPEETADANAAQRTAQVQRLIDRLTTTSPIYNILLSPIVLSRVSPGVVVTRLTLTETHVNSRGSLHGAVSAAIVDFTTGLAIASWDMRDATGSSVDMHLSYLSTAAVGDTLEIEAKAERVGGSLAYTTMRITRLDKDGQEDKLVVLGQHTKFVKGTAPAAAAKMA